MYARLILLNIDIDLLIRLRTSRFGIVVVNYRMTKATTFFLVFYIA